MSIVSSYSIKEEKFNLEASFSNEESLLEFVKDNYKNYLEEKKNQYDFDFSNDNSPALLIEPKPILDNDEKKEPLNFEEKKFVKYSTPLFNIKLLTKKLKCFLKD